MQVLLFFTVVDTRSHNDEDSITSSTVSIEDSLFDQSMEQPVSYDMLNETDTAVTSPSSPSTDELETMRKQGAIPKHRNKPLPPLPEPSPPKAGTVLHIITLT